jgi:phospholipid/cholesterol/gamma-HCH transport system substrate-binding protein
VTALQSPAFRVGALVVVITGIVAAMMLSVSNDPSHLGKSTKAWFVLGDAGGLVKNGGVKMAGIRVGIVKDIQLYEGQARIDLTIRPDVHLFKNASVAVKSTGILGDRYIEVAVGDATAGELEQGGQITKINNGGSMEVVVDQVGKLAKSLTEAADTIRDAAKGEGNHEAPISKIVDNIQALTDHLADIADENHEKFDEIVANIRDVSQNLRKMTGPENTKKIDRTLANVEEISDKINEGKGTIGKLVNDETTVEGINTAVAGINKLFASANKLQTGLDVHSDWLTNLGLYKTTVDIKLIPGPDRFYEVGITDDPKGVVQNTNTQTINNPGPGQTVTQSNVTNTYHNQVKFNVIFGKNFYDFTIRAGLIESSGGIGLDYHWWAKKIMFSADAFNAQLSTVHLRAYSRFSFYHGLYVQAGIDDFSSSNNVSSYIGAGLDFTNDDLKLLLSKAL